MAKLPSPASRASVFFKNIAFFFTTPAVDPPFPRYGTQNTALPAAICRIIRALLPADRSDFLTPIITISNSLTQTACNASAVSNAWLIAPSRFGLTITTLQFNAAIGPSPCNPSPTAPSIPQPPPPPAHRIARPSLESSPPPPPARPFSPPRRRRRRQRLVKIKRIDLLQRQTSLLQSVQQPRVRARSAAKGLHAERAPPLPPEMSNQQRRQYCFPNPRVRPGDKDDFRRWIWSRPAVPDEVHVSVP